MTVYFIGEDFSDFPPYENNDGNTGRQSSNNLNTENVSNNSQEDYEIGLQDNESLDKNQPEPFSISNATEEPKSWSPVLLQLLPKKPNNIVIDDNGMTYHKQNPPSTNEVRSQTKQKSPTNACKFKYFSIG